MSVCRARASQLCDCSLTYFQAILPREWLPLSTLGGITGGVVLTAPAKESVLSSLPHCFNLIVQFPANSSEEVAGESGMTGLPTLDLPFLFSIEDLNKWTPASDSCWSPFFFFLAHQIFIECLFYAKPCVQVDRSS